MAKDIILFEPDKKALVTRSPQCGICESRGVYYISVKRTWTHIYVISGIDAHNCRPYALRRRSNYMSQWHRIKPEDQDGGIYCYGCRDYITKLSAEGYIIDLSEDLWEANR